MVVLRKNAVPLIKLSSIAAIAVTSSFIYQASAFVPLGARTPQSIPSSCTIVRSTTNNSNDDNESDADRFRSKAESLRDEIRALEEKLGGDRRSSKSNNNDEYLPPPAVPPPSEALLGPNEKTLRNKRVMVVGANGQLGSMVTRYLLRNHPELEEVVATVHFVGGVSTRGWGRLSYEVGAEDGAGRIGAAWSEEEERNASFEYTEAMKDYNLNKLRIVEVELLDPQQCSTITEGIDSIIWCATDFNGSTPRSVSSLDLGLLFRAVAAPTKGRVEIEGLTNILGALKQDKTDRKRRNRLVGEDVDGSSSSSSSSSSSLNGPNDPTSVVLVSAAPDVLMDFETPFGEFNGLKRQGERILQEDFPSLTYRILQMGKYEDLFVEEGLEILMDDGAGSESDDPVVREEMSRRKINRRDAAQAAVEALLDPDSGETVQVWTSSKGF